MSGDWSARRAVSGDWSAGRAVFTVQACLEQHTAGQQALTNAEDGQALHGGVAEQGVVLVGGGHNLEVAVVDDQPGPAGAEDAGGGSREVGLEVVQGAKGVPDGVLELLGGIGVKVLKVGSHRKGVL